MAHPLRTIIIGFFLMLIFGVGVPFLTLPGMHIIPLTKMSGPWPFIILFVSYGLSVAGLFLGIIGFTQYVRSHRPPKGPEDEHH